MKKAALLILLAAGMFMINRKAKADNVKSVDRFQTDTDSLSQYTGKFQREVHNQVFYIQFGIDQGKLIGSTLWDGNKLMLKHLSGDNFIVSGINWGVKFIRDKDGKINEVVVRGQDVWTKVESKP
jgi:hypothetical protein